MRKEIPFAIDTLEEMTVFSNNGQIFHKSNWYNRCNRFNPKEVG